MTAPDNVLTGLLARLTERHGVVALDTESFAAFVEGEGESVVLFAEDPLRFPESFDVATVFPEVLAAVGGCIRAGVLPPEAGRALQPHYGFHKWPVLIFFRDGGYVGCIEGMHDWGDFVAAARAMQARPVGRPPAVGVAVAGG